MSVSVKDRQQEVQTFFIPKRVYIFVLKLRRNYLIHWEYLLKINVVWRSVQNVQ